MEGGLDNLFDGELGDVENENPQAESKQDELEDIPLPVSKKRLNAKPQPKLDTKRLMGPRGLPSLEAEFETVRYKGEGHEEEDLNLLLSRLEHWAHRLYPKLTFDDCLEKIERLGHKKEIQVCMKKLRMGMPLLNAEEGTTVITEDGPTEVNDRDDEDNIDQEILNLPMNNDF